ncbi:MAG: hypothetical protein V1659_01045 [Candidatus Woesearchaeota archaeon]
MPLDPAYFNDPSDSEKFRPYYDGTTTLIERIPLLVADGRRIIKPERVLERRTRAAEPAKTNWQNTKTYSSLVQVKHPSRERARWFNWHPLTETIKPGCPLTIDYGLETTEKDYNFNGAPFATINKRQITTLQQNSHALPKLREKIWREVIAAGDEKLFEEYKAEFEAKTGRTFEKNGMRILLTLKNGLRPVRLGSISLGVWSGDGLGYIDFLLGEVPEAQDVRESYSEEIAAENPAVSNLSYVRQKLSHPELLSEQELAAFHEYEQLLLHESRSPARRLRCFTGMTAGLLRKIGKAVDCYNW